MADEVWSEDPEVKRWLKHANKSLRPMIKSSTYTIALMTGSDPDAKQAVEVGFMILMDKPLVLAVTPGSVIPRKLARCADAIVEVDLLDPEFSQRVIREAIESLEAERGGE